MDRLSPTAQALGNERRKTRPTVTQFAWLRRGLDQAGGKLPLFDHYGQHYDNRTIRCCVEQGWAEPWFNNPIKPDWTVCRLTAQGRELAEAGKAMADAPKDEPELREVKIRNLVDDLFA